MPSQKDIKGRISSVKNIRKITRAMEMVAAARLRRAEQRIEQLRPYAEAIRRMTRRATEAAENIPSLPLLQEHENVELAHSIIDHLGVDSSLIRNVEDRAGHDRRYSLDTSKLRALGWEPRREWEKGIRATIDWYRDNRDWWEPIKRSGGFRAYYEQQYAARLA